ncbi:MAG: hypothetical protein QM778_34540 [Myxococcales bacterium]
MQSTATTNSLIDTAHAAGSHARDAACCPSEPSERDLRDSGPWLVLSAPVCLALTVIALIFAARASF